MIREGAWVAGGGWKHFLQLHSYNEGLSPRRILVDISSVQIVEEDADGHAVILLQNGGYAVVAEHYDVVMDKLWRASSRGDLIQRED